MHTPDYLDVCKRLPWVELVGIAAPDPDTALFLPDWLERFEIPSDLPQHDVAVVMTDIASHDALRPSLHARSLFIEKPLAVDGPKAMTLARRLLEAGKCVRLGFFLRHAPALAAVQHALREGRIGCLRHARLVFAHPGLREGWLCDWPAHVDPKRMGGGAFSDLAIHLVDTARLLVGDLVPIACHLGGDRSEESGQAMLEGPNGESVHLWVDAAAPRVMLEVHLVGETGELVLDGGKATLRSRAADEILHDGPMTTPADGFEAALRAFGAGGEDDDLDHAVSASRLLTALLDRVDLSPSTKMG